MGAIGATKQRSNNAHQCHLRREGTGLLTTKPATYTRQIEKSKVTTNKTDKNAHEGKYETF